MKPQVLLVDGHSFVFSCATLRQMHGKNTGSARTELVRILTRYQDNTGIHVAVVFDGRGKRASRDDEPDGIQIFYSGSGQTADSIIERLVAKYGPRYHICVATDDHMEQLTVSTFGAEWISNETLADRMRQAEKATEETIRQLRKRRA